MKHKRGMEEAPRIEPPERRLWWHSIYDRQRFWDSRTWKRVVCIGGACAYCEDGWQRV